MRSPSLSPADIGSSREPDVRPEIRTKAGAPFTPLAVPRCRMCLRAGVRPTAGLSAPWSGCYHPEREPNGPPNDTGGRARPLPAVPDGLNWFSDRGRDEAHVHIPDLDHVCGDGVCRRARRAADCHSGPVPAMGDAGSRVRLHGRRQHEGVGTPAGRTEHDCVPGECAGDQFERGRLGRASRRQAVRFRCSRRPCRNCRRWTASMPASRMAHGCRCGAPATSPKSSATGCVRRRMPTS